MQSAISNPSASSDALVPISALQHMLYCPRQYALIHLEQAWAENRFTAEGRVLHEKAHDGHDESRPGVRITRGLPVSSEAWGLSGVCDVVEFHGRKPNYERVVPIEYKRGKPKAHRADEVQLCAQAVCLEAMLGIEITKGFLFYGKTRRRMEVNFDTILRNLVRECIRKILQIQDSKTTPPAFYENRKCDACSLIELCQPRINERKRGVKAWFQQAVSD